MLIVALAISLEAAADATRYSRQTPGSPSRVYHFFLYEDGGAIEVSVKNRSDKTHLNLIRADMTDLVRLFAKADVATSAIVRTEGVPGTEVMQRLHDRIAYTYDDTRDGGRVRITTRHARALAAIYEFLRFQIQELKTGDTLEVTRVP